MKLLGLFEMNAFAILALLAGAAIAVQATMNAQLGVLLKNSMIGTGVAFLFSLFFTLLAFIYTEKPYPNLTEVKSVPVYLWFSGGALSAFGVGMFYYLIPKMGVGSMMTYALTGQIIIAVIISHLGWFESPIKSINVQKIVGITLLIAGILLINWEFKNGH
jgi:transporter family-2 protein